MALSREDIIYFERGKTENPRFFDRIGEAVSFDGKRVLDVGCGHGSLCVYIASRGAKEVIGVDTDKSRIDFANENVAQSFPELAEICKFHCCCSDELTEQDFDIIVSKDSFEHILNLDDCLADIYSKLKPGGLLVVGFGPLYYSPFGDHRRTRTMIPWGHVIIPERIFLKRLRTKYHWNAYSVYDLGLNKFCVEDYKNSIKNAGFKFTKFRTNVSKSRLSNILSLVGRFRPLRNYCCHNVYAVLQKPE